VKPGTVSNFVGAFWDLMPTFVELTGAPKPVSTDGISIVRELTGKGNQKQHEYLYWEFHENGGRQAVRMGKWKAVRLNVSKQPDADPQLFDLSTDPAEQKDVAASFPDVVRKMSTYMKQAHRESALFPF
jgi:arylsulfatase A-like enzyme